MAHFTTGRRKPVSFAVRMGPMLMCTGMVLMFYLLLRPYGEGIPGWQPVNGSVRAALNGDTAGITADPAAVQAPDASAVVPPSSPDRPQAQYEPPAAASSLIDLNIATVDQLDGLPGIGPSKAKAIAAYREAHRGFRSVDELLQVKGIGSKLFGEIRSLVVVNMRQ